MKCTNCGYEGPWEDFMYPEEGSTMLEDSYYFKCPKCKEVRQEKNETLGERMEATRKHMRVTHPRQRGVFRCPFCEISLEKKEMRFHVGIPLCMALRKRKAKQKELKAAIGGTFPVPLLDYEYFGNRGIRNLMAYQMDRLTMGHPDEGNPIKLEEFVDHSED
jgi:Zn finger protein HypA/HybF involved in hydrogenase expression